MSKVIFTALIIALLTAGFVWFCSYIGLPFWYCLLSGAIFFAAPQANLIGLVMTLFTALLGILFGVIYLKVSPYIPNFPYKIEVIIASIVFLLFLITQTQYLKYFACSLMTLSLLIVQNGDWITLCQVTIIGIIFGFITKTISLLIAGKSLN